jgi:hypothetical protein
MKPARDGSLTSKELGLRLVPEGGMLRLVDARTGQKILTPAERAEEATRRADELAAENERLRALLERRASRREANGGSAPATGK